MAGQTFIKPGYRAWMDKNGLYLKYGSITLLVLILLGTTLFQIQPEEVGMITRFGKYVRKVEPGLNLKIPIIEKLYKVAVERQQKEEFGFRTTAPGIRTEYTKEGILDESVMLTGDLNLADVEWDGDPNQVPTKDKKFIFVDTYAHWQITDPLQV